MANAGSRQTPRPYSRDDAERIRQMVATPGAKIVCPQCDEELTMGVPIAGGGTIGFVRQRARQTAAKTAVGAVGEGLVPWPEPGVESGS